MSGAALMFPVMNGFAKYLAAEYPVAQVIWGRNLGHLLFVLALFAPRRGVVGLLRSQRPLIQICRSLLLLAATALMFVGIKFIPLANATAIIFTAPLIVTVLSVFILREHVGMPRWIAVLVGFAGTLIVIRPGGELFHWAAFLIVGSATSYALYQVLTRRIAGFDSPETTVTYSALVGTILISLLVPFDWKTPDDLLDIAMFGGMGLIGGIGHYCIARAMALAPASIVSPFNYLQILGAVAFGWFVFADFPDLWVWVGSGIIVASGLFIVWRETRRKQPTAVAAISVPASNP